MTTHKDMLACKMSTSSTHRRPRRVVVFDESVTVTETLHINDYTCQEVQACWPTSTEQQAAYFQRQRIICQLQEGTHSTTAASNFRGLEGRTRRGMDIKRQRRSRAISALLEEQALQVSESGSICNVQAMADVYRHQCHTSLADALVLARLDREQVLLQEKEQQQQNHVLPKKHSRTLSSSDSSTSTASSFSNNNSNKSSTGRRPRKIFRRWLGSNIA